MIMQPSMVDTRVLLQKYPRTITTGNSVLAVEQSSSDGAETYMEQEIKVQGTATGMSQLEGIYTTEIVTRSRFRR